MPKLKIYMENEGVPHGWVRLVDNNGDTEINLDGKPIEWRIGAV